MKLLIKYFFKIPNTSFFNKGVWHIMKYIITMNLFFVYNFSLIFLFVLSIFVCQIHKHKEINEKIYILSVTQNVFVIKHYFS